MLRVPIHVVEKQEAVLDLTGPAASLGVAVEDGLCPGPITLHAEVSKVGDSFLAKGTLSGSMRLTCDRCLGDFTAPFETAFMARYERRPDPAETDAREALEDGDAVYFDGDVLDLSDEVRQAVELAVPLRKLCREDCRGLCAVCGVDLNAESCRCPEPSPDGRWAALRDLKLKDVN